MTMSIREVPIGNVRPYEGNPRINDEAVVRVAESIREYGFRQPILCDADMVIIAGHTRLKAAERLGLGTVPVIVCEDLTAEQAKALRIADNKVAQASCWDNKLLIQELEGCEGLFTGFEEGSLFDDTLDEGDRGFLEDPVPGEEYVLTFRTGDREQFEEVRSMVQGVVDLG